MPMDDTLELSPEEAKQAKQRLKEEKKKLKKEQKEQRKAAKARAKEIASEEAAFQRKTKAEAVLFLPLHL